MKERISFVHPQGADVDTKSLTIKKSELRGPTVETTRQDRLTATLEELPTELATFLKSCRELHIRWASPFSHDTLEPFASRLSPGLHVSHIPAKPELHDP